MPESTRVSTDAKVVSTPNPPSDERWSERDRALLKSTARMWPLPIVGMLLTLLTVKFAVTPDGGEYIVLAETLRSGAFPSGWDFIREPGLPLLLRVTLLSPLGVPGYLAVSGLMAGAAVAAMGGVFYDLGKTWQRLVAGLVAVAASIYINYAGYVMQQIGLTLVLALAGLNIRWIQTAAGIRPLRFISLGVLGAAGLYYSFVFFGTVLLSGVVAGVIVASRMRGEGWKRVLIGILSAICVVAIPAAVYAPWNVLKSDQAPARFSSGADLPGAYGQSVVSAVGRDGPSAYLQERLGTALVLLHLPIPGEELLTRTGTAIIGSEDLAWAAFGSHFDDPQCGVFDLSPEWKIKVDMILRDHPFCQPVNGAGFWAAAASSSYYLGGAASVVMAFGTVWAIFRRRELLAVLVLPWGWVAMYSLFLPIDRYAIPIWPYKTVFSIVLVLMAGAWILKRVQHHGSTVG